MKISPELHEQILARVAKGQTLQGVADWLQSAHAIKATKQALHKIVRKHRTERAATAKHVVREHIEKTLPKDLDILERVFATNVLLLRRVQREAKLEQPIPSLATVEKIEKLTRLVVKAEEMKRKALGLDEPEDTRFQGLAELVGLAVK